MLGAPEGDAEWGAPYWALVRGRMVVSMITSPEGRSVHTVLITALRSGQRAACDRTLTPPEIVPEIVPETASVGTLTPPPPPAPPGAVVGAISGTISGVVSQQR